MNDLYTELTDEELALVSGGCRREDEWDEDEDEDRCLRRHSTHIKIHSEIRIDRDEYGRRECRYGLLGIL